MRMRPSTEADRDWTLELLAAHWGSPVMVTRGNVYRADELHGFIAVHEGKKAGLATYRIDGGQCEIISMNSLAEGRGIGTALLDAVRAAAAEAGCTRLSLITSNDNTAALRFWQKRGFVIAAVHRGAIERSRRLKPEIPLTGNDGIPIRDEIEMELLL